MTPPTRPPKKRRIVPIVGAILLPGDGKPTEGRVYKILKTQPKPSPGAAASS